MRDMIIGLIIAVASALIGTALAVTLIGYAIDKQIENDDNVVLLHKLDQQ